MTFLSLYQLISIDQLASVNERHGWCALSVIMSSQYYER